MTESSNSSGPMNVLFICTDQQRARDVGFMGNDVVQTPYLDALAAESMVFDLSLIHI